MTATYTLVLRNAVGDEVARAKDFTGLELALKESDVGKISVAVSMSVLGIKPARDWRLEVWRGVDSRPPYLVGDKAWFVRKVARAVDDGVVRVAIEGLCANALIARRVIAYAEKTPYTEKEGPADDVMKEFVRENLGSLATDGDRQWLNITIAGDDSLAPLVRVEGARKNLLSVLQQIANMSQEQGTFLTFDLTYDPVAGDFYFQTYVNQRGVNRTQGNGILEPVTISDEAQQLDDVEIVEDWTKESAFVYEVGKGSGSARPVQTAAAQDLIDASPFGRIELVHNSSQISSPDALEDAAEATLQSVRARPAFKAKYVDTPKTRYGVDFGFGDRVTAQALGEVFDCRVRAVGLKKSDPKTDEDIDLVLESEE